METKSGRQQWRLSLLLLKWLSSTLERRHSSSISPFRGLFLTIAFSPPKKRDKFPLNLANLQLAFAQINRPLLLPSRVYIILLSFII